MDIRSTSIRFERGIKKIRVSVRLKHPLWSKAESKAWSKTQTNPGLKSQKNKVSQLCKVGQGFPMGTFRNDRPLFLSTSR